MAAIPKEGNEFKYLMQWYQPFIRGPQKMENTGLYAPPRTPPPQTECYFFLYVAPYEQTPRAWVWAHHHNIDLKKLVF